MKLIKNTSLLLLLCSITIIQTKQTGAKSVYTGGTPTTQTPMQPKTPIIQPQQIPIFLEGPRYTEILSILKNKAPDSSDFSTLNNIKHEAEYQINLIQERKPDLRAKKWIIKSAADIKTYGNIYIALKQNAPDSSDLSTLKNIITEVDRQLQSIKKPTIQPFQPIIPKGPTYTEILTTLKNKNPDSSDFQTLQDIIYEAERQMDVIRKTVSQSSGKPITKELKGSPEQIVLAENLTKKNEQKLIEDLFPKRGEPIKGEVITNIVMTFMDKYPNAEQLICVSTIYDAIINNNEIKTHLDQDVKPHYIMKAIHNILKDAWVAVDNAQLFL